MARSTPTGSCFSNGNDAVPVDFFFNNSAEFVNPYIPLFISLPQPDQFTTTGSRRGPFNGYYESQKLHNINMAVDWSVISRSDDAIIKMLGSVMYLSTHRSTVDILAAVVVRDINYPELFWYRKRVVMTKENHIIQLPAISPSLLEFWYSSTLAAPTRGVIGTIRRHFLKRMLPYFMSTGMRIEVKTSDEMSALVYQPKISFESLEEIGEWKSKTMWKIYDNYGQTKLDGLAPNTGDTGSIQGVSYMPASH